MHKKLYTLFVLQLPMRRASRQVVFINTSPPSERVNLLKPLSDIKDMDDDSEDIYTGHLIKRYKMMIVMMMIITPTLNANLQRKTKLGK